MKRSSRTSPRRHRRHGSSSSWIGVLLILAVVGAGIYASRELGWWGGPAKPAPAKPEEARRAPTEARIGETSRAQDRPTPPVVTEAPASRATDTVADGGMPSGQGPIAVPKFLKDFDDAIERGAFREAESVLAKVGGAADAERRLATAMNAASARIVGRFEEIRSQSGERSARVYVSHQLVNFPDHAEARLKLQGLLTAAETATAGDVVVARPAAADSRSESRIVTEAPGTIDGDLVVTKDEAARVLDSGEVKAALSVLREVATAAEARNQQQTLMDARRLIRQGEAELRLRAAIIDRVQKHATGDRQVPHLPGERGAVLKASEEGVTFAGSQGQVTLKWRVLPVHSLIAIVPLLELGPAELVDAAATLYRVNHATEADGLLAKASQSGDAAIKASVDRVLADARGMSVPKEGFRLVDDRWLSPQEFARHEVARDIAQSTKDLAAADAAARRAAFDRMLKLGDAARSPLHRALLLRRAEIREDLAKAPIYAKLADLGAKRQELDEARAFALALIEDEVKYPYPYRPPEASAETFKLFQESQQEVNVRVAKLRTLWGQPIAVTVPKAFREKVALLNEIVGFLAAVAPTPVEPDPGWLVFLPQADEVTLQTVATSEADRNRIDESAVTMKTNATRATKAARGELDEARITNEYRVMFGRAAVLVHDLLTLAAHGHCEDMTRVGFFAHMSPVPGKRSPDDRVRLTGMRPMGVSENIAQSSGPAAAHEAWCHSSGHHRNLLAAGWRLLGVGNAGHTWCQNFSAGEEKPTEAGPGGGEDQ